MTMKSPRAQTDLFGEIAVDLFAGGGGFSTGFSMATGRVMDIAVNHDPAAILMHTTNHRHTEHFQEDVFLVDPRTVCRGRPVGLLWASPDCKHFSKAKGAPLVDRKIRGLSWVVLRWALDVQPRVIGMENVEEIQTWGPLIPWIDAKTGRPMKRIVAESGKPHIVPADEGEIIPPEQLVMVPDPARKGETFRAFIGMLSKGIERETYADALAEACEFLGVATDSETADRLVKGLGYDVDHTELVAADFGAPTTRKRWVLIARRDGRPIAWPERTHAPADSELVKSGKCKPWRSATEIIDWSLPTYSVFETKEEIRRKYGATVDVRRPLAENTMRRIIRGVDKFTIRSGKPFIVPTGYGERAGQAPRVHDLDEPLPTVVGTNKENLVRPVVAPFMADCNHAGDGHIAETEQPLGVVTQKCTKGLVEPLLAPVTFPNTAHSVGSPADQPVHTIASAGNQILAAAQLASIGQTGGGNRIRGVEDPVPTVVSKQEACLVSASLIQYHDEGDGAPRVSDPGEALPVIDGSNRHALVTAQLTEYYGNGRPLELADPLHTATAHDREALSTAILQVYHDGGYHGKGNSPEAPVNTVTGSGGHSLVCSQVVEFKGDDLGQSAVRPLRTITASCGQFGLAHVQVVRYEPGAELGYWPQVRTLLNRYCGYTLAEDEVLLILVDGVWRYIRDITMRMLTPRELYAAQGFPPDYIIDRDYTGRPYPKNQQVARCGNSVSPQMTAAVVRANFPEWAVVIVTMAELNRMVAV